MKKQSALVLIGLLILIAGMAISHLILVNRRRPRDEPPSEDPKEAFTWFDTLGFPDVKGRPFVRVATGRWYQYENDPPRNTYVPGFLLEDTGDTFSVLTVSRATETYRKTHAKTAAPEQVGYEVLDLVKEALPCARGYAMRSLLPLPGRTWSAAGSKSRLHPVTEVFVLAWACRRNGLDSLADELCAQAARIPKGYGNNSDKP